jgi:hypothetical protein
VEDKKAELVFLYLVVLFVIVVGLWWTSNDEESLSHGDYLGAVATVSGLLAVGHGIRHHRN